MLSVKNLNFSYQKNVAVLRNLSFDVNPGFTLLIGENGSGKTTLIKNIVGLLKPRTGSIDLEGTEYGSAAFYKKLSYLPQEFNIYPSLKVKEILRFIAEQKGVPKARCTGQIEKVSDQTNIQSYLEQKFKRCSLGTQKRVGIAAALLGNPDVIILDEPTAGIDPKERLSFYKVVRECFCGKAVLLSTHILDDMEHLANHVVMLKAGTVVYQGSYEAFCNTLNDRLYEVVLPSGVRPEWLNRAQIVTEDTHQESITYRFVSEGRPDLENCKSIMPTTEDIWNYYSLLHSES